MIGVPSMGARNRSRCDKRVQSQRIHFTGSEHRYYPFLGARRLLRVVAPAIMTVFMWLLLCGVFQLPFNRLDHGIRKIDSRGFFDAFQTW